MNVIRAQWKQDVAYFRTWLAVWGVCVIFDLLCLLDRIPWVLKNTGRVGLAAAISATFLSFILFFLLTTTIIRVIQKDPLTKTGALGYSHPIFRLKLLVAKSLFIGPLLIISLLASAHIFNHSSRLWILSPELWIVVFGLIAFAAVTSNFGQLVAYCIGIGMLTRLLLFLLGNLNLIRATQSNHSPLFLICGFLSVTIYQYFTLNTKVSLCLLFLGFFLIQFLYLDSTRPFSVLTIH